MATTAPLRSVALRDRLPMPCVEPVTSATFPGSPTPPPLRRAPLESGRLLFQGHEPIRTLDLNFNEGHPLVAAVHHVMGDASGTHVAYGRRSSAL